MRPALAAALGLAAMLAVTAAVAQDSGAMCRSFCDAEAKECRQDAREKASAETDPLIDTDFGHPFRDDFSTEKKQAATTKSESDRRGRALQCSTTRLACVQRCRAAPPAGAEAASAPPAAR